MDIFSVLSYLNKISLLAFIITALFLGYQFYLLKKESSHNPKKTPTIPDFNENEKFDVQNYTKLNVNQGPVQQLIKKKDNKTLPGIIIASGLLIITIGVFLTLRSKQSNQISNSNKIKTLVSPTKSINKENQLNEEENKKLLSITPTISPIVETNENIISPTNQLTLTVTTIPSPTEVILAIISPTITTSELLEAETVSPTEVNNLPLTGTINNSLYFFGLATTLIFLAFVF